MARAPGRAAVALRRHIDRLYAGSVTRFCSERSLDRVQVLRTLKGQRGRRASVDFALSIERATGGDVPVALWASGDFPAERGTDPDGTPDAVIVAWSERTGWWL